MTYLPQDESVTKSDIRALETRLGQRFESIDQRFESLDQRLDRIETRLNSHEIRFDNLHEALRQQTRTYMFASIGTMISLSVIAFGAAALI
jgi:chaperonin cofactor prefoldin